MNTHIPVLSWGATDVGPLPPGYVNTGNVIPSPYQIKPGETLGDFSFRSPHPPGNRVFYAQGFALLPSVANHELLAVPQWQDNSFVGLTVGPMSLDTTPSYDGGRRPSIDGFLGFLGFVENREIRVSPVAMILQFSMNGETVDTATFAADLNGVDVTASFESHGDPNRRIALFDLGSSPLVQGRNVLITTIDGTVPDTTRTASDVDRLTFYVQ